jgi:DNA replication and repair protein RecF
MYLRNLEIQNFRNYERLQAGFCGGVAVLHGPNGAGKTNVLEAICVAATGHSPRTRAADEIVRRGCEHAFLRADFAEEGQDARIEVGLAREGKRQLKIQGAVRKQADLIGLAPVVYFSTDDIGVVRGEPGGRRRLIDRELSAVSRSYYFNLVRYRRAIQQRNQLLRDLRQRRGDERQLKPWESAAARHGSHIVVEREAFINALAPEARAAHAAVTAADQPLALLYRPSIALPNSQSGPDCRKERARYAAEVASVLLRCLEEMREADVAAGVTTHGPHRDDIELRLGEHLARTFGSQGEQRSCAVAVRLGLAAVVHDLTGRRPVLLLDDVLSELDEDRRRGVFAACARSEQVIITCCDYEDLPEDVRRAAHVLGVRNGELR